MKPSQPKHHPEHSWHQSDEADIGSGEKTPAQHETEELIRQIPPLPERDQRGAPKRAPHA